MSAEGSAEPAPAIGKGGERKRLWIIVAAIAVVAIIVVAAVALVGLPQGSDGDEGVPAAPTELVINSGGASFWLYWNDSASQGSGVTHFTLCCYAGSPVNYTYNWTIDPNWAHRSFSYSEVNLGWTYHFYVVAVNDKGESARSNEVAFAAFFSPSATQDHSFDWGDGWVNMSWSPPLTDGGKPITGYLVCRKPANDYLAPTTNFSLGVDSTSFNDTTAVNGVGYEYCIGAVNEIGYYGTWCVRVNPGAPSEVTKTIVRSGDGCVNLIWTPPLKDGGSPITKYEISRYVQGEYTPQYVTEVSGSSENYLDTGLTNGLWYYYNIVAYNDLGGRGNDWQTYRFGGMPTDAPSSDAWNYPANEYEVGDYAYYELTLGDSFGGGLAWRMNYSIVKVTTMTVTLNTTKVCVAYGNWTLYEEELCLKDRVFGGDYSFNGAELVGTEFLPTVWGMISTDHWTVTDDWGATYEIWIHDGIMIKTQSYTSGTLNGETLLVDTNLDQIVGP